jgi:hypothetical protein
MHRLGPNSVVDAIQYNMNMSKNLVLCHLEMSNAEIDQKYEIRTKKISRIHLVNFCSGQSQWSMIKSTLTEC